MSSEPVDQWMSVRGLTWPSCFYLLFYLRCSCLPISPCLSPISKPPPPHVLTWHMHTSKKRKREKAGQQSWGWVCVDLFTSGSRLSAGRWWWEAGIWPVLRAAHECPDGSGFLGKTQSFMLFLSQNSQSVNQNAFGLKLFKVSSLRCKKLKINSLFVTS